MAKGVLLIVEGPESDREDSGVRIAAERQTAKVPRVELDRLLAEERALAGADDTLLRPPPTEAPPSMPSSTEVPQERTLRLQAPSLPPGVPSPLGSEFPPPVPSPLGSEFPPPVPELTAVLKYTPIPIPIHAPPPTFEEMRAARDEARRTKRLVVAIWAFALTLAGSLGYFVASQS